MSNSPMAKPVSLQPFNLKKHKSFSALALPLNKVSATEQLTAVFQKHQQRELEQYARNGKREGSVSSSASTLSTPALSYYSNATSASNDSAEETDYSINDLDEDSSDGLSYPPSHAAPTSLSPPSQTQTRHSEFGHCTNEAFRYVSAYRGPSEEKETVEQEPPMDVLLNTYMSYLILIILGHLRDFFGKVFFPESYAHLKPSNGYAALNSDFDNFFTRRMKKRIDDCFSRPVTGVPGRTISLLDRQSEDFNETYTYTGGKTRALNVSSYNYLGFAQARGGCADAVEESLRRYGISPLGPRLEGGTSDLHIAAEALVAKFMGTEDALITSMGFATNSTNIPALVSKGSLVISDELNHASIRLGVRMSGASVRMFKHNDMKDLERLLREVISQGQPRTHRPWKKILIIVEGLYSMEGTMCNLPGILELKERYKFYLFIDEAHSIGALGPHGRGVTDYFSIPPTSIDLLMGTFTKSFGAAGGYIAGSKAMIDRLRLRSHSATYAESITPSVLTQIVASMGSIMGVVPDGLPSSALSTPTPTPDDSTAMVPYTPGPAPASLIPPWLSLPPSLLSGAEGTLRLRRLAFNCRYLARGLRKLGFMSSSHPSSPIVPLLLFHPGKMPSFSRMMLQRKTPIVVVVVGYPATPLTSARVRFCLSASHTKEDVDLVLEACDELGDYLDLKRGCGKGERWSVEEIKRRAVELVEM